MKISRNYSAPTIQDYPLVHRTLCNDSPFKANGSTTDDYIYDNTYEEME